VEDLGSPKRGTRKDQSTNIPPKLEFHKKRREIFNIEETR
jgi:hypothetical protein